MEKNKKNVNKNNTTKRSDNKKTSNTNNKSSEKSTNKDLKKSSVNKTGNSEKKELKKYKRVDKKLKLVVGIIYLLVWALSVIEFYKMKPGNEMGVFVLYLYILLPIVTIITSIFIGREEKLGYFKWFLIILFAFMYFAPLLGLGIREHVDFISAIKNEYFILIIGGIISAFGMGVGALLRKISDKSFRLFILIGTIALMLLPMPFIITSYILYYQATQQTVVEDNK